MMTTRQSVWVTLTIVSGLAHSALGQASVPAVRIAPATSSASSSSVVIQAVPAQSGAAAARAAPTATTQPPGAAAAADETAVAGAATASAETRLSPTETIDLQREWAAASDEEKAAIRAFYKDLGIDVDSVLAKAPPLPGAPPEQSLLDLLKPLDFARTPAAILAARSAIGFGTVAKPEHAANDVVAKWLHLQIMAGEWPAVSEFMRTLPADQSAAIYAHMLQSLNRPPRNNPQAKVDPGLLPEEVLAVAACAPAELLDWQVDVLAQFLKIAATRYSTGPMLAAIAEGSGPFGTADDATRGRTVRFLVNAGLVVEAYAYFPSLDDARARKDAGALVNHGRYQLDLAASPAGSADAESLRRAAWQLFAEVTLMAEAEAAMRQDALRRAIDLLPSMPPAEASVWLREVFSSASIAPAALEVIALKALALRNARVDVAQRVQTILTMKESVDTLLAQTGLEVSQLRVPLRMLTTALVGEAEMALEGGQGQGGMGGMDGMDAGFFNPYAMRQQGTRPEEMQLLLKAMPDERWLAALEPSLSTRAYHATIGVATGADEIDVALEVLANAVRRHPAQSVEFADRFLQRWQTKLVQPVRFDEDMYFYVGYVGNQMASAPLTRGRQRRNLDRLGTLMTTLDAIGVNPRQLPSVAALFKACHGRTEVFTREGIEAVFGPIDSLAPRTAASLAEQMRSGLSGDWRDRRAQEQAGMKRSVAEIGEMVERGYALALELIEWALRAEPNSWRWAVTKAGIAFDRVQFKQAEQKADFAAYNQYRKEAFAAFAQTASRYAELVRGGNQRDDPSVYLAWFNAAVGATELNYLTRDDLLVEGSPQDDQIDLIRKAFAEMPDDAAQRHVAAFAGAVNTALPSVAADVKPRIVRHALRIIGDHPAGASLRRLADLYQDLVKDEIKLRLAVDGDDRVGANRQFAATLSLRFTQAVDRETGGFSRYLQNDVWTRVGNTYRPTNYRDQLRKDLEAALRDRFEIDAIGFFEALAPPRPVKEAGEDGWLEKPVAYLVLRSKDPSGDRMPAVSIDMVFNDTLGPVTLPVVSNAPPIECASPPAPRPTRKLEVLQTVDLRDMHDREKKYAVTLEVAAKCEGVVPDLGELLPGFREALPGYSVAAEAIEVRPVNVLESDKATSAMFSRGFFGAAAKPDDTEYARPDEHGMYRLATERSWMVTYTPTGGAVGTSFVMPTLAESLDGALVSRQYADMDVVTVTAAVVPVSPSVWTSGRISTAAVAGAGLATAFILVARRRRRQPAALERSALPARITPLSTVAALRRLESDSNGRLAPDERESLGLEIAAIEARYFGRGGDAGLNGTTESDLRRSLERWIAVGR